MQNLSRCVALLVGVLLAPLTYSQDPTLLDAEKNEISSTTGADIGKGANPTAPVVAEIRILFKLDPQLTRGLYMGDRWVAPKTYTSVRQPGQQGTVQVTAWAVDRSGRRVNSSPEWIPANPDIVAVSPAPQGGAVTITVQSPSQSSLRVTSGDVSKVLAIKATYKDGATQVEISQGGPEPVSAAS